MLNVSYPPMELPSCLIISQLSSKPAFKSRGFPLPFLLCKSGTRGELSYASRVDFVLSRSYKVAFLKIRALLHEGGRCRFN